jgi:hypothetical protein
MTPRIRSWALAVLFAAMAGGFAAYEARKAVLAGAAERALEARRAELDARFRSAQRDLQEARRTRLALEQRAAAPPALPPAGADLAGAGSSDSRSAWFAAHPEARRRYLQAFREGLVTTWGLLFQRLNLSPDQEEKLKDLLAQREDNDITVEAAAGARGLDEAAPEIQALDDQLDAANKAALRDLLGKAGYNAVRDFLHDEQVIPLVDQLAGSVYASPTPLTGDQAVALTQALADSSQKKESGRVIGGTIDWDQAIARAQSILAPAQLAAFSSLQQQAQAQAQIKQMMAALRAPAPAKSGP